jgi:hypothetical protein
MGKGFYLFEKLIGNAEFNQNCHPERSAQRGVEWTRMNEIHAPLVLAQQGSAVARTRVLHHAKELALDYARDDNF